MISGRCIKWRIAPERKEYLRVFSSLRIIRNPSTTIEFSLPLKSNVDLSVFNFLGERVETLVSGARDAGNYKVSWGANVASGIYFFRLNAFPMTIPEPDIPKQGKCSC